LEHSGSLSDGADFGRLTLGYLGAVIVHVLDEPAVGLVEIIIG